MRCVALLTPSLLLLRIVHTTELTEDKALREVLTPIWEAVLFRIESTESMSAVLDNLGIDRTDIYAQSFGALQTVLFAAQFPDRIPRPMIEEGMPQNA
jgi:hypothetical protein